MDFFQPSTDQQGSSPPSETGIPGAPSSQFALLNYFFPGYSMLASAVNAYMGADLNTYMPLCVALVASTVAWNYIRDQFWSFFHNYCMTSVTIRTDDEVYNMVMLWLSRQNFAHNSRHFVVNTNINSRNRYMYYSHDDSDSDDDGDDEEAENTVDIITGQSSSQKQALHYTPSVGEHLFWYKLWPLTFERVQQRDQNFNMTASEKEELRISCFGRNPQILKELLLEARQLHMKKDDRKTIIYRANLVHNYWQRCMSRPNRPFSTVILKEQVKQELIRDAADYLNPATRRWYANRGIPYRRGYLLYGPPGTGKSSLSLALAGYFRMKIYIVSLSSTAATEENLSSLFLELPTRCVVLLEDIDSAGLTHTREEINNVPTPGSTSGKEDPANGAKETTAPQGRISLSGLLNILDGVASQEGRILVMTTNHVENLDKALIRPGRVDMVIPFGLADSTMSASIFSAIYTPYENESTSDANTTRCTSKDTEVCAVESRSRISEHVARKAEEFAKKMPEFEFSPAEIQGLLLKHKLDPDRAVESVDSWVAQVRREKQDKAERESENRRKDEKERETKIAEAGDKDSRDTEQGTGSTTGPEEEKKGDAAESVGSISSSASKGLEDRNMTVSSASGPKMDDSRKAAWDSGYDTP